MFLLAIEMASVSSNQHSNVLLVHTYLVLLVSSCNSYRTGTLSLSRDLLRRLGIPNVLVVDWLAMLENESINLRRLHVHVGMKRAEIMQRAAPLALLFNAELALAAAANHDNDRNLNHVVIMSSEGACHAGWNPSCQDNINYRSKLGTSCNTIRIAGFICHGFREIGFTDDEVDEMIMSCPCACSVECKVDAKGYEYGSIPESELTLAKPTEAPTTFAPSDTPSQAPTASPTAGPSASLTIMPSYFPSFDPSGLPSTLPISMNSVHPSAVPTVSMVDPTRKYSAAPSALPTATPTVQRSSTPSTHPTRIYSAAPSALPTAVPTVQRSAIPSTHPTRMYSAAPSALPTAVPTARRSSAPSTHPTSKYSAAPSALPTAVPTVEHSSSPSSYPTRKHSSAPSEGPTTAPAIQQNSIPPTKPSVQIANTPTPIPTQTTQIDSSFSAESRISIDLEGKKNEAELSSDIAKGNNASSETNMDENESTRDSILEKNQFEMPELVVTDTDDNAA